ncbi:hypothetical protein [Winogradskyella thalassocola]|uniref:Uncharacterized protein n=1 Tax=Winogradskyella thalassocola TaxID=262004 RepID=A0A1G8K4N1_9FLAO|nr:hypothetical protein [Winogradskyella thalassocola]SDI38398.1 hypothetical protein SAMN04489796_11069 [Winogradskyella thalassocola]
MRLLYFIVLFFLSSLVYGQKSVLLQNTNTRAKELKHHLNQTEDSIVFKCDRTIYELMIFNDDFERVIKVKDTVAKIQISDIPVGRYAVEAVLRDKLIIITLLRNESFGLEERTPSITNKTNLSGKTLVQLKTIIANAENPPKKFKILAKHPVKLDSLAQNIPYGSESNRSQTDLRLSGKKATPAEQTVQEKLTAKKNTLISNRIPLYKVESVKSTKPKLPTRRIANSITNNAHSNYWVIYKINNGSSSEKVLKIADQKTVDRMIQKIEIDMKTSTGRLNELTVWQIYDTTNFVQHKRKNRTNYMNIESDSFNLVPYYKVNHDLGE